MKDKNEKIIIIGAGISGLTAGIYGRLAGYEVEIYEKNALAGGECTGWDRKGYHIDNCIHWLIGTKDKSDLNDIWRTTGAVVSPESVHNFEFMYVSEYDGQHITLWKDIDRTERELIELSPEDETEIRSLMDSCRRAQHIEIPAKMPEEQWGIVYATGMLGKSKNLFSMMSKYKGMDIADLMTRFKSSLIRRMLRDFCTKESPAYTFPMAYGNFAGGDGGIPIGGSRAMAIRMADKFKSLGGTLYLEKPVAKLNVEDDCVASMTLEDGTAVEADYFVPACDASFTFNALLNPSYEDNAFREFWSKPELYIVYGTFQAAFAVDSPKDFLDGDINLDVSSLRTEDWMGDRIAVKTYAYESEFAPAGKQVMQMLWGGTDKAYEYFKALYETDKAAYQKKKQEIAENLLKRIEERWPEYEGKLSILDVWTPVTYERYCHAYRGYYQSCVISKHVPKKPKPSPFIKGLKNVVLAGQWLSPPGGVPSAAITGKFAIDRIKRRWRFNRMNFERIALTAAGILIVVLFRLLAR